MQKKILFTLFFVFFFLKNIQSSPQDYRPIMIIDCSQKNGVFKKDCFKQIDFATLKLSTSGRFENVRSITNHSFLVKDSRRVYTTTLSESMSWKMVSYFLKEYQSESTLLMDPERRYALVLGQSNSGFDENCMECMEIKDTLTHSRINSWIWTDTGFENKFQANFLSGPLRIELVFTPREAINKIKAFNTVYFLQHLLYSLPNVATVYSPVNIYAFLSSVVALKGSTPEEKWASVLSFWELGGQRRSSYIDFEKGAIYIDIFTRKRDDRIAAEVQRIMESTDPNTINSWNITESGQTTESKKNDSVEKKQTLSAGETNENKRQTGNSVSEGNRQ